VQKNSGSIHVKEEEYPSKFRVNNRIEILTRDSSEVASWFATSHNILQLELSLFN